MTTSRGSPSPDPPDAEALAGRSDARLADRELQKDERDERRAMHDLTRHHQRGGHQAHQSQVREREEDDLDLARAQKDGDRREDAANRIIAHQAQALVRAERSAGEAEDDLRGAFTAILEEVGRIETSARSILTDEQVDLRAGHVDAVRASARRIQERVERVLHPR